MLFNKKMRSEAKDLRTSLFVDYSDCVFTRYLWDSEKRLNGADYASEEFPPKRLVQITYAEAIESLGFRVEMENELKGFSLKKLRFLRALHTICVNDNEGVEEAFSLYPKHRLAFEKLREARRKFSRDLEINKARLDEDIMKLEQVEAKRLDLSQKLRDKEDLLKWLTLHGSDPDFWHVIVCNTDPSVENEDIYHWIASQPQCDAGTAAQIFHHSNAYEALEYRTGEFPQHLKLYSTAKLVADRWETGNFQTHRFSPNDVCSSTTYDDFKRLEREAAQKFGASAFKVPDEFFDDKPREVPKTDLFFSDF